MTLEQRRFTIRPIAERVIDWLAGRVGLVQSAGESAAAMLDWQRTDRSTAGEPVEEVAAASTCAILMEPSWPRAEGI